MNDSSSLLARYDALWARYKAYSAGKNGDMIVSCSVFPHFWGFIRARSEAEAYNLGGYKFLDAKALLDALERALDNAGA